MVSFIGHKPAMVGDYKKIELRIPWEFTFYFGGSVANVGITGWSRAFTWRASWLATDICGIL
jgi:hypothetical protein